MSGALPRLASALPPWVAGNIDFDGPGGCWLWLGRTLGGYGTLYFRGRQWYAHRLVYTLILGSIPDGLELDHVRARGCASKACVRPVIDGIGHVEAVTHRENILRGNTFCAENARKTHCPKGHPYSGENLCIDLRGYRQCRECHRACDRRAYVPRGIDNRTKTHCDSGHEFTPENTYVTPEGYRKCRTCRAAWRCAYEARQRTQENPLR